MTPITLCSPTPALPPAKQALARGFADRDRLWRPGQTITVGFLDGSPALCERVFEIALIWTEFANIKYQLVKYSPAKRRVDSQIRVSFAPGSSWSYVGTDALSVHPLAPTMQLGWLTESTPTEEIQRVVLHEFGHALGLLHEHQHPAGGIPWDRAKVIEYYKRTNGWTAQETEANVLDREAVANIHATRFDAQSIMLYAVPKELTSNGYSTEWNRTLSEGDKEIIARLYPQRKAIMR